MLTALANFFLNYFLKVLLERGKCSQKTNQLINNNLISVTKEFLAPGSEFWESGKTLKRLAEEDYFRSEDELVWPDTIKKMISDSKFWKQMCIYQNGLVIMVIMKECISGRCLFVCRVFVSDIFFISIFNFISFLLKRLYCR